MSKVLKVFISQPMTGVSIQDIRRERARFLSVWKEIQVSFGFNETNRGVHFIDSFLKEFNPETNDEKTRSIKFLSKSLELMADADIVYFACDPNKSRGCKIEYEVAKAYGKRIVIRCSDISFLIENEEEPK